MNPTRVKVGTARWIPEQFDEFHSELAGCGHGSCNFANAKARAVPAFEFAAGCLMTRGDGAHFGEMRSGF